MEGPLAIWQLAEAVAAKLVPVLVREGTEGAAGFFDIGDGFGFAGVARVRAEIGLVVAPPAGGDEGADIIQHQPLNRRSALACQPHAQKCRPCWCLST